MSWADGDGPAPSWWPCGEVTDALADAVLEGDWDKAKQLSREFKELSTMRVEYDALVSKLCDQIDECRWDDADVSLEQMALFPDMVSCDLVYYHTVVCIERRHTVLDRIVQATED